MITVLGLGFVGLTTAIGLSEKGFKVHGYDIDNNKVSSINNEKIPFFEKDLEKFLKKNLKNKNLFITNDPEKALKDSKVIFLCVGTPSDKNGKADLKYVYSAIDLIIKNNANKKFQTIVIKSTVPPSTTSTEITDYIKSKNLNIGEDIGLANNPEFLREGNAWDDFINPDRIVIGTNDDKSNKILGKIYSKFDCPLHITSLNDAEFIKYLSNTTLATLISFANEMSVIASNIGGIDIKRSFEIVKSDKRWFGNPASMSSYLHPGCGFGGYCLPKDSRAMIVKSKECGFTPKILESVIKTNDEIKKFSVNKIIKNSSIDEKIGILGLSFKPNSDDVRDTPSAHIIKGLIANGYKNISAYDPISIHNFQTAYPEIRIAKFYSNLNDIIQNSDILVRVTNWHEFDNIKLKKSQKYINLKY